MEIKIGIKHVGREVNLETTSNADEVMAAFRQARTDDDLLVITDDKGRTIAVPAAQIGYLDLGVENIRQVGFGAV